MFDNFGYAMRFYENHKHVLVPACNFPQKQFRKTEKYLHPLNFPQQQVKKKKNNNIRTHPFFSNKSFEKHKIVHLPSIYHINRSEKHKNLPSIFTRNRYENTQNIYIPSIFTGIKTRKNNYTPLIFSSNSLKNTKMSTFIKFTLAIASKNTILSTYLQCTPEIASKITNMSTYLHFSIAQVRKNTKYPCTFNFP